MPPSGGLSPYHRGTKLKTFFTIWAGRRYHSDMLLPAAVALAASAPQGAPRQSIGAVAQVTATVRVISGVRVQLDGQPSPDAPIARDTIVHTDGTVRTVKLIEFE